MSGRIGLRIPLHTMAYRYVSRFLLVSLNIDAILHESTISRRREKLRKMTNGLELGDVYDATIERIKAQEGDKSRLGMATLMWISHAERPVEADELCHALAVQLGSIDFDFSNIPSMLTLVSCCQGLVTVDKEGSTVRLVHFTLQEYISSRPDIFSNPQSAIAEICLTYLNSQLVKALSIAPSPDTRNAPFLEYCSLYWGVHAKRELSDYGISLAVELLKENYCQISTELLLTRVDNFYGLHFDTSAFSGLHCASFFGIVEVVAGLIDMGCYDINEGDSLGCTPLAWAARNGHDELVEMLLGREEVNPDKADKCGQTPLSFAAQQGQEGAVKMLLGREGVNPHKPSRDGQTPLSVAAWYGHGEVVKTLLEREEVQSDRPDNDDQTPLSYAAWNGHEGVVKILLEREEVNPDKADNGGRTPLSLAAKYGHERVVEMLLEREKVIPDRPDNGGQTALSLAAKNGHEAVVKILLKREEVIPDRPDNGGRTPLSLAAQQGHEGVVKILLGRNGVNPDKPSRSGETPLLFATWHGHEGVVKILLGREDVIPDSLDNDDQTPLSYATQNKHDTVVALLQSRKVETPNTII